MLLSIIIPVYNVAQYIVKWVDSIINQEVKGKCGRADVNGHTDPADTAYEPDRDPCGR